YEDDYGYRLGTNSVKVRRSFSRMELTPFKRVILIMLIIVIAAIGGWFIGIYIATTGESKISNMNVGATEQEENVYKIVDTLGEALRSGDTSTVTDVLVSADNNQPVTEDEAESLVDYFERNQAMLTPFISKIKTQTNAFLDEDTKARKNRVSNLYYYIGEYKGKVAIMVHHAEINAVVKTDEKVKVKANGTDLSIKERRVEIPNVFPSEVVIEGTFAEEKDTLTFDFIKLFLDGNHDGFVARGILFKRGAGKSLVISTNAPEADVYVNGEKIHKTVKSGEDLNLDGLKPDDKVRLQYKGKMSSEEKVGDGNRRVSLEFKLEEFETRFNLPKKLVDGLEGRASNFFNAITNGVSTQNAGALAIAVDGNPGVQQKASTVMQELTQRYNSLLFSDLEVVNAVQGGDGVTLTVDFNFDSIDKAGTAGMQKDDAWVKFNTNGQVIDFGL
ncbi:TcaA second domain-containing protein, partial [Paraclostridium bifermentans]